MPFEKVRSVDVVVVGAGTAGSAAAVHLAKAGKRVVLIERGTFDEAGARWVNGGASWMFERAGIPEPIAPELRAKDFPFLLHDSAGDHRITLDPSPVYQIDMRLLVQRLHGLCKMAGVTFLENTRPVRFAFDGERPTALTVETRAPNGTCETTTLHAKLFVDGAGIAGVLRNRVPELARHCPPLDRAHLCSAAQQVRKISDFAGARAHLERHGITDGSNSSNLGVDGGFSSVVFQIDLHEGVVEILTGALAESNRATGMQLIEDFVSRSPWIGEVEFGGSGVIPLRRPYDRQAAPGIALVGNSGCQVFPAHGSGIATGMIAGKILAETVGRHEDPGSLEATWAFQAAFMREVGAVNAAYDVFRRLTQQFSSEQMKGMFSSGLISPALSAAGLMQRLPRLTPREMAGVVRAAAREPRLAAQMLPASARMFAVYALYKLYPARPDMRRLQRWSERVAALFREKPDLAAGTKIRAAAEAT